MNQIVRWFIKTNSMADIRRQKVWVRQATKPSLPVLDHWKFLFLRESRH